MGQSRVLYFGVPREIGSLDAAGPGEGAWSVEHRGKHAGFGVIVTPLYIESGYCCHVRFTVVGNFIVRRAVALHLAPYYFLP